MRNPETPLKVYITVDTEFSVGEAFVAPETNSPVGPESVYCHVAGHSEGLGFMLDTLKAHDLTATFFVEALNTLWFGDEPMGAIARLLQSQGQDVQLHLHPFWLYFQNPDWRRRLSIEEPQDRISGQSTDFVCKLLQMGVEAFERWGVPRPKAFRSGNLDADENVYLALNQCGIHVASNIGLAINRPKESSLWLTGGAHRIHGVTELPILSYRIGSSTQSGKQKTLTITGSSWSEIRTLLLKARRAGYQQLVLLTHPFEFIKAPPSGTPVFVNRINQDRFRRLCRFLEAHPEDFQADVIGNLDPGTLDMTATPTLNVSPLQAATRMVVNHLNDRVMRL
jgi:peptidoglycan/xylan/chitin deacetylase (PgdA/CDA1 family)